MKLLTAEAGECDECLDDLFCPRGPVQDFCLDFNQIESMVTFG